MLINLNFLLKFFYVFVSFKLLILAIQNSKIHYLDNMQINWVVPNMVITYGFHIIGSACILCLLIFRKCRKTTCEIKR